ncbi:MAG: prepilin-type N-terminal cleavage/methylation domain-containing protein [Candidatus Eremiobacteraeota bacterium]|nr:prepilin-type N-terminal cleavage/methylation domain-containing protein [Candidatus Eremiobacteraeota bacterium]
MTLRHGELGFTLIETLVATAVAAIALGGIFFTSAAAARYGAHQSDARRDAATLLAEQTLRTAADSWKYAEPGTPAPQLSGSWSSGAYAISVGTTELTTPAPNDPTRESATIRVTVSYTPDPPRQNSGTVSVETTVRVKAPVPGSTIDTGTTATPPPGAP